MQMNTIGVLYSLGAAICGALYLIPYKAVSEAAARSSVVFGMLLAAAVLNSVVALCRSKAQERKPVTTLTCAVGFGMAACTVIGNASMSESLIFVDPAVTSVVLQVQILCVACGELVLFRQRIQHSVLLGSAMAFIGIMVMHGQLLVEWFNGTGVEQDHSRFIGIVWALVAAVCWSVMLLIAKRWIEHIDIIRVNALRLWMSVAFMALWPGAVIGAAECTLSQWWLLIAAAASGPTLGRLWLMSAVRYISASQTKLITLIAPPCALLFGWLYFSQIPSVLELLGGCVILVGVALPLLYTRHKEKSQ